MNFSNNHKYVTTTVLFLSIGWLYFWIISYLNYVDFLEQFTPGFLINIPRSGKYNTTFYKIISISLGITSLFFSTKAKTIKYWHKELLIFSSFSLLFFSMVYFINIIFNIIQRYYTLFI